MYMNNGGDPMMLRGLREIVVQDLDGDAPAAVALAWVRSLTLPDGVHIIVATMMTMRRPRRLVVYGEGLWGADHLSTAVHRADARRRGRWGAPSGTSATWRMGHLTGGATRGRAAPRYDDSHDQAHRRAACAGNTCAERADPRHLERVAGRDVT